jgi:hypothetical protein
MAEDLKDPSTGDKAPPVPPARGSRVKERQGRRGAEGHPRVCGEHLSAVQVGRNDPAIIGRIL